MAEHTGDDSSELFHAIKNGEVSKVAELLDKGIDINILRGNDGSALAAAAGVGNENIVSMLLERGADVNSIGGEFGSALAAAASVGNENIVSMLLEKAPDVNSIGGKFVSALAAAASVGNENIVSMLLEKGADVNSIGGLFGSALGVAAGVGNENIVSMLLAKGADVNSMLGMFGSALAVATGVRNENIVSRLLEKGADVNFIGGLFGSALAAAANAGNENIVSMLLEKGADVNFIGGLFGSALAAAARVGNENIVSMLLDKGADINSIGGMLGSTLATAVHAGRENIVSMLLEKGADVNSTGGVFGSALAVAARVGNENIVSMLLDKGADINVGSDNYGPPLCAAARGRHKNIVKMLLEKGANVDGVAREHGTALCIAVEQGNEEMAKMLLHRGADKNTLRGKYGTALCLSALREENRQIFDMLHNSKPNFDNGAQGGEYGHALIAAAYGGSWTSVLELLVSGVDVNTLGGDYGTALGAAAYQGRTHILTMLLDAGASLDIVCGEYGTALGMAAYKGNTEAATILLRRGADVRHIGGRYHTTQGGYPTALDAALSGRAESDLTALLTDAVRQAATVSRAKSPLGSAHPTPPPPLPTEYKTPMASADHHVHDQSLDRHSYSQPFLPSSQFCHSAFRAGSSLTREQADFPCSHLNETVMIRSLTDLVGLDKGVVVRFLTWIQNDIRYFVVRDFDFGLAYATARVWWKHFNEEFDVKTQRARWSMKAARVEKERVGAIFTDSTGQELIKSPYSIMPRRIWDLKSNRVVDFRMLHSEINSIPLSTQKKVCTSLRPAFWAVSHSWTSDMRTVWTPVNTYQWPVPLPDGVDLEQDIRKELLLFGGDYVWLDVLCLRQSTTFTNTENLSSSIERLREVEWKLDVPTIGNVYRIAEMLVRYFNGLGRPFSLDGWDDPRHWLRRAWTLQEILKENRTFNGGFSRKHKRITMNAKGIVSGKVTTLRLAIQPVQQLANDVDSPGGCQVYELAREMAKRCASEPLDKGAGLFYLLRTVDLPTYDVRISDETAWTRCFHVIPYQRKIEILFDFPFRGTEQQWFPTWRQLIEWPGRDPNLTHSPAEAPQDREIQKLTHADPTLVDIPSVFVSKIWGIAGCRLLEVDEPGEYDVQVGNMVFDFYYPYQPPVSIDVTGNSKSHQLTLATLTVAHTKNWVLCEELKKLTARCKLGDGREEVIQIHVLKKLGVLRTDSCSQLRAGVGNRGPMMRMDALFV